MKNPYSLQFGKEPEEYISRLEQKETVINSFLNDEMQIFMVTGVRGSGKTAFMSNIKDEFSGLKDWVVIEISGTQPVTDIDVALSRMLEVLKKHKKKLLVTVDEVIDNQYVREFATSFQILIRDKLPIYLLMTGLNNNIDELQNEKNLTFLHRAPKIHLNPLNIGTMASSYRRNIKVDDESSIKMAQLTKGYPYAFQVLGYLSWKNEGNYEEVIDDFKQYLDEYVYDKIWSGLSPKDKYVLYGIASVDSGKVSDIREFLKLTSNEYNPYSRRLKRKELIKGDDRGYVEFALPLFDRFVIENYYI